MDYLFSIITPTNFSCGFLSVSILGLMDYLFSILPGNEKDDTGDMFQSLV